MLPKRGSVEAVVRPLQSKSKLAWLCITLHNTGPFGYSGPSIQLEPMLLPMYRCHHDKSSGQRRSVTRLPMANVCETQCAHSVLVSSHQSSYFWAQPTVQASATLHGLNKGLNRRTGTTHDPDTNTFYALGNVDTGYDPWQR